MTPDTLASGWLATVEIIHKQLGRICQPTFRYGEIHILGYWDEGKEKVRGELTGRSDLAIQLLHVSQELARDSLLVVDLDRTLDEEVRDVVPGSEVYISFRFEKS